MRALGGAAVGGALASAGLVACAGRPLPAGSSRSRGGKAQLVYQDSGAEWFVPMVVGLLEQFHATHPNIRVFYTPEPQKQADIEQTTMRQMESGTAADVIQGCCTWFPLWAQRKQLLDLRPYVAADIDQATLADWNPVQYRALFAKDGSQFGLPKYCGALGLYYNKDLFDEYGVGYPEAGWTYDDYQAAMQKLTLDRDHDGQTDVWGSMMWLSWIRYQVHINGWGGHIMDPVDDSKCRLAEREALAALEWLRARTWDDRVMANKLRVNNLAPSAAFAAGAWPWPRMAPGRLTKSSPTRSSGSASHPSPRRRCERSPLPRSTAGASTRELSIPTRRGSSSSL